MHVRVLVFLTGLLGHITTPKKGLLSLFRQTVPFRYLHKLMLRLVLPAIIMSELAKVLTEWRRQNPRMC